MKMLRVTDIGGHEPHELLLNPNYIVSIKQSSSSIVVIVFSPNISMTQSFYILDGIEMLEKKLAPIKMLGLKMRDKEHKLLLNPAFIISAEREFDSTKVILSCPCPYNEYTATKPLFFEVSDGIASIEEKLTTI